MQAVSETTSGIVYQPRAGACDEACEDDGAPRPHYEALLDALAGVDLERLVAAVDHDPTPR